MGTKAEIEYDFNNAKSLKVYPRKSRQPISEIALSNPLRVVRTALNASEKELKHVMDVANRRMRKVNKLILEKESSIADAVKEKDEIIHSIISEGIKSGDHLVDEVFIPEYLGFLEIPPENEDDIRIYAKEGHSITRIEDGWMVVSPDGIKTLVKITSMRNAIVIFEALGLDVNFKDYVDGKYSPEIKTLEENVFLTISKVIKDRGYKKEIDGGKIGE